MNVPSKPQLAALLFAVLPALVVAQKPSATDPLAPIGIAARPPTAPVKPVTETLWDLKVTDDYRYMEKLDPATIAWIKAQGAYTRTVLDAIKPLAELQKRVSAFTGSFGSVQGYVSYGGRAFYEERKPGADDFDLVVRNAQGTRKLVDIAAWRAQHGGKPYAINWFLAAPDGSKVAVGISEGGSENASLYVYDTATGKQIAGPVDRAEQGATAWSNDAKTVYFNRLQKLKPGEPGTDTYRNSTLDAWDLKHAPMPILGATAGRGPRMGSRLFPVLSIAPGAPFAAAIAVNGVHPESAVWLAPRVQVNDPKVKWTKFVNPDDGVTNMVMRGDDIFLLSHKHAPTFQVLALKAGAPLSSARVLVPAQSLRVIEDIHAASDALYVLTRKGSYSELLRVPAGTATIETVPLPFKGHVLQPFEANTATFTDPRTPGIVIDLNSWVVPDTWYAYSPVDKRFSSLHLGVHGDINPVDYTISDLHAKARNGVEVPLTLVQPKGVNGPQITILVAYGSYGISELAHFSPRAIFGLREGINFSVCHVRGGGELGEAWRLAGKDANKHNTWQDLIACDEDLIARGVTSREKLFILGGSAGGIAMGRALTERPDLFAGVLDQVPAANTLRFEFSPNGPPNIPEFGSVKSEQGFKNLYAMDSIQHVKHGVTYPAVMITTGLNDPRVSPWEPAKFTAALQASGTPNPVLLRVDAEAGHGIGSTRTQEDEQLADFIAFIKWRAGVPGWRPDAAH